MILSSLSACAGNTGGSFCTIGEPIYASDKDTEETLEQIDRHNAAYEEICP